MLLLSEMPLDKIMQNRKAVIQQPEKQSSEILGTTKEKEKKEGESSIRRANSLKEKEFINED